MALASPIIDLIKLQHLELRHIQIFKATEEIIYKEQKEIKAQKPTIYFCLRLGLLYCRFK